jgi:hypothetical protein
MAYTPFLPRNLPEQGHREDNPGCKPIMISQHSSRIVATFFPLSQLRGAKGANLETN